MTTPHIRDLDINGWSEVPKGATIPAGTRHIFTFPGGGWGVATDGFDRPPSDRNPCYRYFTADPIPDPRGPEIEAEAKRLWDLAHPDYPWDEYCDDLSRVSFRRLAIDSLDR